MEADTRKSSAITDHPFEPRDCSVKEFIPADGSAVLSPADPTWLRPSPYLCRICRMAEAAHSETTVKR